MAFELSSSPESDFIEYNNKSKRFSGFMMFFSLGAIVFLFVLYLVFLRRLELFHGSWISLFLGHIKVHVFSGSALGLFYVTVFGGLFFLFTPIEAFYFASVNSGRFSFLHAAAMAAGIVISYSINYILGVRFSRFSRKFVSAKQFYRSKVILNKFGSLAVFFFNIIGAGSQQLTFVLGVFRYNKTRVFVFSVLGQLIKYAAIALAVIFIF